MALKGNLRDFSITQLLNLVNLARKTGTLVLESPRGAAWVSFREGKLAYAQMGQEDNSLAGILYRGNKLTGPQFRAIKERAGQMSDKELGLLLINANYISQREILANLQAYFVSVVNRLFPWAEGFFRFENNILPPEDKITLRMNLENIIIEGTRQLREWETLQEEIPSLEMALKFPDRPGANLRNLNLCTEEWRVISYINPKNTIRQIARAVKLNDLEIRRIIYSLIQAGLVEIVRAEGAPSISPTIRPGAPKTTKAEQKTLIQRIIGRIRSL